MHYARMSKTTRLLSLKKLRVTSPISLKFPWQTLYNGVDCGIFVMRHMETFKGTSVREWDCGLSPEGDIMGEVMQDQSKELCDLRIKYLSKILLSNVNSFRSTLENEIHEYANLSEDERMENAKTAKERVERRLSEE
ncbi:hypothetical protein HanPI659440_Chr13g0500101 [Helianthus annuus]|nr:hypothetical protein HanPI659440_Chr13g0500101 [Helianthus annuus]